MSYQFKIEPDALSDLKKLTPNIQSRILKKIRWFAKNFENMTPLPLTANLQGFFKLRIGDYRVIYTFDDSLKLITISQVGHRRDIYD
ncbi:MAG: type II toxin-antitoxin system RelE/ParE family toxin [Microcystaceae cyanobacterium]